MLRSNGYASEFALLPTIILADLLRFSVSDEQLL